MSWNIAPECVSTVILCIIWVYSRKGNPLPTARNRLFQCCFLMTFCAMTANVVSTFMIFYYQSVPLFLNWLVAMIYFVATPLMGTVYFYYTVASISSDARWSMRVGLIWSIPAAGYLLLVLTNPFHKLLFDLSLADGYTRGPWLASTYVVFYFYCLACVVLATVKRKVVDRAIFRILLSFPLIAAVVIVVQQMASDIILSGSAATCALLLIYLYLQNKQISIDYLTGLSNRQEFLKMLELKLKPAHPGRFAVVVLSLREFKQFNHTYGQYKGDLLLQMVARYLRESVPRMPLYRYSGDEFAILADENQMAEVDAVVRRLLERMETHWVILDLQYTLSAAFGVVHYPESAGSVESIINGIEYAVSIAKRKEGRPVCFCDTSVLESAKRREQIVQILRQTLRDGSFELYYQPIYSVREKRFVLAEALLRLNHTPLGAIYPNEFIPIAEETGVLIELTYQILDRVCRFVGRLLEQGAELEGVGVNFSALQFTQKNLVEQVLAIIGGAGIPYSKIKIEITESTLVENQEEVDRFASAMHGHGVRLELDDFGTGYSNIASAMDMPIDIVKLDKSLVWSSMKNEKSSSIVRSLSRIFHDMGMVVLAEGVETDEQREFVVDCGCDFIQGFLFARPMPEREFEDLLLAQARRS